jgi:benzil reductase ((S)-benzoin forming)
MIMDAATIVWISGATSGIGAGLARTCPHPGAEIINLSRHDHPDFATVRFDLRQPDTWDRVADHFTERLATFRGQRAIFIHNAFFYDDHRFAGEGDAGAYRDEVTANVVAPLILGDAFLRAARPAVEAGVEVGLLQMSSGAAKLTYPGTTIYSAGKAAMEQWVRVVRAERRHRGQGPWVIAVRPGFVDTPSSHRDATQSVESYPLVPSVVEALARGEAQNPDIVAAQIWASLPPSDEGRSVLWFGEAVMPVET